MADSKLGRAVIEIVVDGDKMTAAFAKGQRDTQAFADKASKTLGNVGSKLTVGATLPIVALGAVAVKAASDTAESLNKMNVVFGQSSAGIQAWAQNAATSMGMSRQEAYEAVSTFGSLFKTMGTAPEQTAQMSKSLVQLAADLASFNNIDPTQALEKLRSGLVGESEPLRSMQIVINESMVAQEAYRLKLASTGAALSEGAKIQARYSLIMQQSAFAQGDYARTADGLANSTRTATAQLKDAAAALGENLIPLAKQGIDVVNGLAEAFNKLGPEQQRDIVILAGAVALLGPAFSTAAAGLRLFAIAAAVIGGPVTLALAGVAALITGGVMLWQNYAEAGEDAAGRIHKAWQTAPKPPNLMKMGPDKLESLIMELTYGPHAPITPKPEPPPFVGSRPEILRPPMGGAEYMTAYQAWQNQTAATAAQQATQQATQRAEQLKVQAAQNAANKIVSAFQDMAGRATSVLNDVADNIRGLAPGLFPGGGNPFAPGANGPFEALYRIADIAVNANKPGSQTGQWQGMYGLSQGQAAAITQKAGGGNFFAPEVVPYVDWEKFGRILLDQMQAANLAKFGGEAVAGLTASGTPLTAENMQAAVAALVEQDKANGLTRDNMIGALATLGGGNTLADVYTAIKDLPASKAGASGNTVTVTVNGSGVSADGELGQQIGAAVLSVLVNTQGGPASYTRPGMAGNMP